MPLFPANGKATVAYTGSTQEEDALGELFQFLETHESQKIELHVSLSRALYVDGSADPLSAGFFRDPHVTLYAVRAWELAQCESSPCPNDGTVAIDPTVDETARRDLVVVMHDGMGLEGLAISITKNAEFDSHVFVGKDTVELRGSFKNSGLLLSPDPGTLSVFPFSLVPLSDE